MSVKLALLKSGETVISDIKEVFSEEKSCGYVFYKPYKVLTERSVFLAEDVDFDAKIEVSLSAWILLTQDDQILVPSDWVVTIVEPLNSVKEIYEERVNG